jgi:hypothetical protein
VRLSTLKVFRYCNINNTNLRVAGATTPWVSKYCNIYNINLQVAGAMVCGHLRCLYGNITQSPSPCFTRSLGTCYYHVRAKNPHCQTTLWRGMVKVKYFINSLREIVITRFISIFGVCVQVGQTVILQMQILGGMPCENCIIKVTQ